MEILKAVLVDDEKSARETLEELIQKYCKQVHIVAHADSVDSAIRQIEAEEPHLVFLDIDMPLRDGFDLLRHTFHKPFKTIFTTAYNQYALKAIKFSALDYLVKPIDIDELVAAVNKVEPPEKMAGKLAVMQDYLNNPQQKLNKIILPTQQGYVVESLDEVIHCESDSNYTLFHFNDKRKITVCRVLKEFDELLSGQGFFRVHQSHLINIKHIKKYIKGDSPYLIMSDGAMVSIARNKKAEFLTAFFDKMVK